MSFVTLRLRIYHIKNDMLEAVRLIKAIVRSWGNKAKRQWGKMHKVKVDNFYPKRHQTNLAPCT